MIRAASRCLGGLRAQRVHGRRDAVSSRLVPVHLSDLDRIDWSASAAWIALLLSLVALLQRWLSRHKADVVVWLEGHNKRTYIVVANLGSAPAKTVNVSFSALEDGATWQPSTDAGWPFPITVLGPSDRLYVPYHHIISAPRYLVGTVSWRDARLGEQKSDITTGVRPVPVTSTECRYQPRDPRR